MIMKIRNLIAVQFLKFEFKFWDWVRHKCWINSLKEHNNGNFERSDEWKRAADKASNVMNNLHELLSSAMEDEAE